MKHRKRNNFWTITKGILLFYLVVFIGILAVERQMNTLTNEPPSLRLEVKRYAGIFIEKTRVTYEEGTVYANLAIEELRRQGEAFSSYLQ